MTDDARRLLLRRVFATTALLAARPSSAYGGDAPLLPSPVDLLTLSLVLLTGRQSSRLGPFLDEWPHPSEARSVPPATVPATRWLPQVKESAPRFSAMFVDALVAAAPSLAWRRSYSAAAVGATFYENYGWTELAGLTGPIASEHLACGVLILGSHLTYPSHRHEAEEVYVPLSGTAEWRHGSADWRERPPGSVIHHARNEPHAMRTGRDPMLALYLWRSDHLAQTSHLD